MKIEKATPRFHPITWISIGLNIFFSYYVLDLRVSQNSLKLKLKILLSVTSTSIFNIATANHLTNS